jgi:hypothetical protein
MALYYTLPVYKASYKLLMQTFSVSQHFAREYKYTIGQDMKNEGTCLIKNIYRANKTPDKVRAIEAARENLEMIRLFLRLMQDCGQVSLKQFVMLNLSVENVSKQLAAWEKYSKSKKGGIPPESSETHARAQASERSKSHNPLVPKGEEYSAMQKTVSQLHHKSSATNSEVIIPPSAGNRSRASGALNNRGSNGNYWSSSVSGTNARNLNFNSSSVNPANTNNRANGFSVRCVKDLQSRAI